MPIEVKWFPPSWFQIETGDKTISIDPAYLRTYYLNYSEKIEFSNWPDPIDGLPEKDLGKADVILITHHHKDHCKSVTAARLRMQDTAVIATKRCVTKLGSDISVIQAGEEIELGQMQIRAVEAYNIEKQNQSRVAHKKGTGVGYVINVEGKFIYHAGDTDLIPEMENLGNIDLALLPIGNKGFTMGLDEAVQAAMRIQPGVVIPMHRFAADPQEFKRKVERASAVEVAPQQIGEAYRLH